MNNGDLISRDAMINMCKEVIAQEWNNKDAPASWAHAYESFVDSLETAPAVDAVEVVHSKWKLNDDGSGTCMNCHRHTKNVWDYDSHMKYCPECGAKMDGERRSNV